MVCPSHLLPSPPCNHSHQLDEEVELKDLATVLIARLAFRFDVNHLYVNALCHGVDSPRFPSSHANYESDNGLESVETMDFGCDGSNGDRHSGHPEDIHHLHHHEHTDSTGSSHNMLHSPPSVAQSEPSSDVSTKN